MHRGLNPQEVAFRDALIYNEYKEDLDKHDSAVFGRALSGDD